MSSETIEREYPSVDLAYPFAVETYQWAQKRKEAVDNRIQTLSAFAISLVLVVPPLIHSSAPATKFTSAWFILAMILFAIAAVLGTVARFKGELRLIDPRDLYNEWLSFSEWEFKKNMIYFSGLDLEYNYSSLLLKRRLGIAMLISFSVGGLFLVAWLLTSLS